MPVTTRSYRLLFYSEKLLPRVNGYYTGCRIATHANGCALATNGESTLTRAGRTKGRAGRRADLVRGWQGTGDTTRSSYNQAHISGMSQRMYPWLPQPTRFNTTDWSRVVEKLDEYAIGIAVRLSALPTSAELDDYTRADHQILIYDRLRGDETWAVDPMHNHSSKYRGDKVPLAEVRKAAAAIEAGTFVCELYPLGGWTAERLSTRELRSDIAQLDTRLERVIERRNELSSALTVARLDTHRLTEQVATLDAQVATLTDELAASQTGTRNAKAAGWESALVNAIGTLQALRSDGPGGTA